MSSLDIKACCVGDTISETFRSWYGTRLLLELVKFESPKGRCESCVSGLWNAAKPEAADSSLAWPRQLDAIDWSLECKGDSRIWK